MRFITQNICAIILFVLISLGTFSGCGNSSEPVSDYNTASVPMGADNTQSVLSYERETYNCTTTDKDGYKIKYTLTIGSWVKGSDSQTVKNAWHSVGGKSDMPPSKVNYRPDGFDGPYYGDFDFSKGVCAFGTVTFENVTPGWNVTDREEHLLLHAGFIDDYNNDYNNDYKVLLSNGSELGDIVYGHEYTDRSSAIGYREGWSHWIASVIMNSNKTTPIPVWIGVENVFTPKHPDGNPDLDIITFTIKNFSTDGTVDSEDIKFQIPKKWDNVLTATQNTTTTILPWHSSFITNGGNRSIAVNFIDSNFYAGGYDRDLAMVSLIMSHAAYDNNYGKEVLEKLGFTDIWQINYLDAEILPRDKVAYSFGFKTVSVHGTEYNLISVAVRGTTGNWLQDEWTSNAFGQIDGFAIAESDLYTYLQKYISNLSGIHADFVKREIKFLLAGHSRGAAVVNLLAESLINSEQFSKADNVMAYTFATPNTVTADIADSKYNIVNFVNPLDSVTGMPNELSLTVARTPVYSAAWKHGLTLVFPAETKVLSDKSNSDSIVSAYTSKMKTQFFNLTGKSYDAAKAGQKEFDHNTEVYWAWLLSTDPTSVEYKKGKYKDSKTKDGVYAPDNSPPDPYENTKSINNYLDVTNWSDAVKLAQNNNFDWDLFNEEISIKRQSELLALDANKPYLTDWLGYGYEQIREWISDGDLAQSQQLIIIMAGTRDDLVKYKGFENLPMAWTPKEIRDWSRQVVPAARIDDETPVLLMKECPYFYPGDTYDKSSDSSRVAFGIIPGQTFSRYGLYFALAGITNTGELDLSRDTFLTTELVAVKFTK